MDKNLFGTIKTRFNEYINSFSENGVLHPMQQLKKEHCFKVALEAREIASNSGLDPDEVILAECAGVLHDIGRFLQFRQYKTFYDPESVNHGSYGRKILEEEDILEGTSPYEKNILLLSTEYHNARILPDSITGNPLKFLNVVRDADKLDIFSILNEAIRNHDLENFPELVWSMDQQAPPNPKIIDDINCGRGVHIKDVNSLADFSLLQISWVYSIHYTHTLRIMDKRNMLQKIIQTVDDNPDIKAIIDNAENFLKDKILKT